MEKRRYKNVIMVVITLLTTFSLFTVNNLYIGSCAENGTANILSRFYSSYRADSFFDIVTLLAIGFFYFYALKQNQKFSLSAAILSVFLSFFLVLCTFYKYFDSSEFMFFDKYQVVVTFLEVTGFSILLYYLIRIIEQRFLSFREEDSSQNTHERLFFVISAAVMLAVWMIWILIAYPGGTNIDAVVQLENFYNDIPRTAWQPPFSTLIMGGLFELGRKVVDANFGFVLYEIFQALCGAIVFSYSLYVLVKNRISIRIAAIGTAFFAFLPMWGAYAQWFEKDFLYTIATVLFATLCVEVFLKKECIVSDIVKISLAGIVMSLLRGNGIYAIIPTVIALALLFKGKNKRNLLISTAIILLSFEVTTRIVYPCMGIGKTSVSETIGAMFQATARYVTEYPEEVTDYEKEVLTVNFQDYDNLLKYDPRINDPVKIYYNHLDFKAYLDIWIKMFFKHPGVYIESVLNGSYGYLAPVSQDIGPWIILEDYDPYLSDLGVVRKSNSNNNLVLVWLLNINANMPIIRYLVSPGLYSWISVILAWVLIKNKKRGAWILLVPNIINILVCMASPLADAMRYALPTVACTPLLIGSTKICCTKCEDNK